jgi:two-component system, sensor histidine kinase
LPLSNSSAAALVQLLRAWHCHARSAPGADAAVDAVQRGFRPDCVLADFRLGDGNGCQAIDRLRRLLGPHLPAALVTGDTGSERVGAAAATGLAVLRKPVKPLQLRAWLNAVFAGR